MTVHIKQKQTHRQKTDLQLPQRKGRREEVNQVYGVTEAHTMYTMDKQQRLHRELSFFY